MVKYLICTKQGKTYTIEREIEPFVNKKIGEVVSGDSIGLQGYELELRGGSDKQGFPMRKGVVGTRRVRPILTKGVGMRKKDMRKRKTIRGNTVSEEISQINLKVIKEGPKKIEEVLGKEAEGEQKTT